MLLDDSLDLFTRRQHFLKRLSFSKPVIVFNLDQSLWRQAAVGYEFFAILEGNDFGRRDLRKVGLKPPEFDVHV